MKEVRIILLMKILLNGIAHPCSSMQCPELAGSRLALIYEHFCYRYVHEFVTWGIANANCKSNGGNLPAFLNGRVNDFLTSSIRNIQVSPQHVWIGAHDNITEGKWQWTDGSDWDDKNTYWKTGKPEYCFGVPCLTDCAYLTGNDGTWSDAKCSETHTYFCQYATIQKENVSTTESVRDVLSTTETSASYYVHTSTLMASRSNSSTTRQSTDYSVTAPNQESATPVNFDSSTSSHATLSNTPDLGTLSTSQSTNSATNADRISSEVSTNPSTSLPSSSSKAFASQSASRYSTNSIPSTTLSPGGDYSTSITAIPPSVATQTMPQSPTFATRTPDHSELSTSPSGFTTERYLTSSIPSTVIPSITEKDKEDPKRNAKQYEIRIGESVYGIIIGITASTVLVVLGALKLITIFQKRTNQAIPRQTRLGSLSTISTATGTLNSRTATSNMQIHYDLSWGTTTL